MQEGSGSLHLWAWFEDDNLGNFWPRFRWFWYQKIELDELITNVCILHAYAIYVKWVDTEPITILRLGREKRFSIYSSHNWATWKMDISIEENLGNSTRLRESVKKVRRWERGSHRPEYATLTESKMFAGAWIWYCGWCCEMVWIRTGRYDGSVLIVVAL